MRIGLALGPFSGSITLESLVEETIQAERMGFASGWLPNYTRSFDALTVLTVAARETSRLELGTFVVPTYPRHPSALAQQALTVQAASGNRLCLGIGLSHKVVIEAQLGMDYSRPIPHMREYLAALTGLLSGAPFRYEGDIYRVNAQVSVPNATPPPVIVAALGPDMLRLCGRMADGTATWMGGLAYLRDVAVPALTAAAATAGRPAPRIVSGIPVCVTADAAAARETANRLFELYGRLPSYRATLDRGSAAGPGDIAIVGSETDVEAQLRELAAVGVTDLNAAVFSAPGGSAQRTLELLAGVAGGRR